MPQFNDLVDDAALLGAYRLAVTTQVFDGTQDRAVLALVFGRILGEFFEFPPSRRGARQSGVVPRPGANPVQLELLEPWLRTPFRQHRRHGRRAPRRRAS